MSVTSITAAPGDCPTRATGTSRWRYRDRAPAGMSRSRSRASASIAVVAISTARSPPREIHRAVATDIRATPREMYRGWLRLAVADPDEDAENGLADGCPEREPEAAGAGCSSSWSSEKRNGGEKLVCSGAEASVPVVLT